MTNHEQQLLDALKAIVKEAGPLAGLEDHPTGTINTIAHIARHAVSDFECETINGLLAKVVRQSASAK